MLNSEGITKPGRIAGAWCLLPIVVLLLIPLSGWAAYQNIEAVPGLERGPRYVHCLPYLTQPIPHSIQQHIQEMPWRAAPDGHINQGFTTEECWLRTDVRNRSEQTRNVIISTDYALLDWVEMVVLDAASGRVLETQRTGQSVPYVHWPVPNQNPSFQLTIPPGAHWQLVWRARSAYSLQLNTRFDSEQGFYSHQEMMLGIHCLFFGAMLVMVVYNLFVFFAVREKVYLLYVFWSGVMTLFQILYWGFAQRFLWPESQEFSRIAMATLLPFIIIFGPWFTRTFLRLDALGTKDDMILRMFSLSGVLLFACLGVIDYYYLVPLYTLMVLLMVSAIAWISFRRLGAGDRSALYFTVAWLCFIFGASMMALSKLGLMPVSMFTENMVELGTALEVVLLSLALAERIKMLKLEGQKAKDDQARAEFEANKARELSQTKSEFLAAMSHEIRTPMNGVLAMADLLRYAKLPPEPASYVDTIFQSTKSLLTVINDILDYSRIESGKMEFDPIDVEVESLVDECIMLFSIQSRNRQLPLVVGIDASVPRSLYLDPVRVKQIINNLLANAFKFTEQGYVKLKLYLEQPGNDGSPYLAIEVEDTGIGMSEEEQGRLFQEFSQADRSIVRRYGGSGLGLTICKKLAELMQGRIEMHSREGEGSRFVAFLPVGREHGASPEIPALLGKKALLVESEDIARDSYRQLLQRWGMDVITSPCLRQNEPFNVDVLVLGGFCADECAHLADINDPPPILQLGRRYSDLSNGGTLVTRFLHTPVTNRKLRQQLINLVAPDNAVTERKRVDVSDERWGELQVLVAEDNPVNQLVVRRLLEKLNITPTMVEDGQQAYDYAVAHSLDIILMDCDMPVMDGYRATEAIRETEGESVWIIGLSAKAADDEVKQARACGMNDYLPKPVTLEQLRETIERSAPVARLSTGSTKSALSG